MNIDTLIGRRVQNLPARLHCKLHPNAPLVIGDGKGPHIARTSCGECGKFTGWISRPMAEALTSALKALD